MNQFEVLRLFKRLWEIWPNKDKEHAAQKALKVLCNEEEIDPDRLVASANIYAMELRGHCYELGNWIRNDIWKDIYVEFRDVFEYEAKLKSRRKEAIELIEHWRGNRQEWWCSIANIEDHIPAAEFALRNKTFKDKWKEAFDNLLKIFASPLPEGDWRNKITPSFTWFCKVEYDSSTVLKIIEGEYGKERKEKSTKKIKQIFAKRSEQLPKEEAAKSIRSIFDKPKTSDPDDTKPKSKFGFPPPKTSD